MRYKHVFSICAYKDSPYLERCIRSLKAQTAPSHIIICTSTPSRFIDGLAWKYGIRVFVRQGESNIRDDWNFAYASAEGELVTIAHQDDMYHRDYTKELLAACRRYPDMTVFTTDYVIVKKGKLITGDKMLWIKRMLRLPLRIPALNDRTWVKRSVLMLGNPICCPSVAYRKLKLGEPLIQSHYSFALDWDTMLRLAEEPGRFICAERPLLFYRIHEEATTKACIRDNRRELEEEAMFSRFWPAPVARWLMGFYRRAYEEYD
ncbi:MAG: glycosyltransferase family 2 protein [Clostridium sp.]|nr:glycosyltransferase family 2 protein [Clostridium sp.]